MNSTGSSILISKVNHPSFRTLSRLQPTLDNLVVFAIIYILLLSNKSIIHIQPLTSLLESSDLEPTQYRWNFGYCTVFQLNQITPALKFGQVLSIHNYKHSYLTSKAYILA